MKRHVAIIALAFALMPARAHAGSCRTDSPILQRIEVQSILDDVALIHSIDPDLLSAMARVESNECVDAISPKGAVGLLQLMPATASDFGVENRFDPAQNALGAARFIDHLKNAGLTLPEIIAAYNAGEGAVARAGGIPHYRETQEYVRRVLWLYLLGHVPHTEKPQAAMTAQASHPKTNRRYGGSDSAILAQLAEVRRAREKSQASAATP